MKEVDFERNQLATKKKLENPRDKELKKKVDYPAIALCLSWILSINMPTLINANN